MRQLLFYLTRLGVNTDYEDDVSRRIVYSNVVFISLPVVYLVFMVIDYKSYGIPLDELRFDQLMVPIIIGICVCCLWLNSLGRTTISRIVFIGLWPVLLHLIPIYLLQTPNDYYLAYPVGIVFHSILIQLLFSYRAEWLSFWTFMVLNLLAMILSPDVLTYFDLQAEIPHEIVNDVYYFYDGILYWLLFNLVTFYTIYVIGLYIEKVNSSLKFIEVQRAELNSMNQNLEAIVSKRTAELEEQNEKLRQVAFFNAHKLRGPFCRIQGLIQLQDLVEPDAADFLEIKMKLGGSIEELDLRIREIQQMVKDDKKDIE